LHPRQPIQSEKRIEDAETENLERSFAVNATDPLLIACLHCTIFIEIYSRPS
jgi:hypothetical protein